MTSLNVYENLKFIPLIFAFVTSLQHSQHHLRMHGLILTRLNLTFGLFRSVTHVGLSAAGHVHSATVSGAHQVECMLICLWCAEGHSCELRCQNKHNNTRFTQHMHRAEEDSRIRTKWYRMGETKYQMLNLIVAAQSGNNKLRYLP